MNAIGSHVSGLQHIGLPTNDMEKTLAFYEKLGFTVAFRTVNNGEKVCFLKLAGVCVETYENGQAVGKAGAIDHIALDVDDVQAAWDAVRAAGLVPPGGGDPVPALLGQGRALLQYPGPQRRKSGIQPDAVSVWPGPPLPCLSESLAQNTFIWYRTGEFA